jgi:hypothetical protein
MNGTLRHHVQTASAEAVSSCRTFGDEAWSQQYIHICCFICSHEFILSVLSYYNMLYLFVLILKSCCLCCYLFIFSCSIIIHVPCLYAYYIYMIHMLYVLMIHIVMDIFEITISMINYLLHVIIIMLIYGIKMIWKMPIFLTGSTT